MNLTYGWVVAAIVACASCGTGSNEGVPTTPSTTLTAAAPELELDAMEAPVARFLGARLEAVKANAGSAKAWADLGFGLDAHMLLDDAEACLARSLELDPAAFEAAYDYAFLGTMLPREVDDVAERFERAAELNPAYAPTLARFGDFLLEAGYAEGALQQFDAAVGVFDGYAYAKLGRARALVSLDRAAEAIPIVEELRRLAPADAAVAAVLAQALTVEGRMDEAAAVGAEQAAAKGPSLSLDDSLRASILRLTKTAAASAQSAEKALLRGDFAGAEQALRRALETDPKSLRLRGLLAQSLLGQGLTADARTHLAGMLTDYPGDGSVHALLGQLDTEKGDFAAALAHFAEAEKRVTLDGVSLRAWITALGSVGRWDEAIFRADAWIAAQPGLADPYYLKALALKNAGRTDEASASEREAIRLDPKSPLRGLLRR